MPPRHRQIMLMLKANCLFDAAIKALEGGNEANAILFSTQAQDALDEARQIEERARAQ